MNLEPTCKCSTKHNKISLKKKTRLLTRSPLPPVNATVNLCDASILTSFRLLCMTSGKDNENHPPNNFDIIQGGYPFM